MRTGTDSRQGREGIGVSMLRTTGLNNSHASRTCGITATSATARNKLQPSEGRSLITKTNLVRLAQ
jgi:hypothetical protein